MRYTLIYSYNPDETGPTAGEVQDWLELDRQVKESGGGGPLPLHLRGHCQISCARL